MVTTVAAGKLVLEDGRFTRVDELELLARAQKVASELASRAGTAANVRNRPSRVG